MNRVKAAIGILSIFILGALTGSLGTGYIMKQHIRDYFHGPEPPLAVILRKLSHDLDLTANQQEKIRPIVEQARTRMTALKEKFQPEFQAIFDESTGDIKAILTEAQRPKLDRLRERMKHRDRRPGHGGPHGPKTVDSVARYVQILNLTEAQIVEAQPLLARIVEHQKTLQAALKKERQAFRAKVSAVEKDWSQRRSPMDDQLAAILDTEQIAEYRRVMAPRGEALPHGPFPD
ncbi:MAG: hypothetical protein JEZ11_26635 [Desulfobacterales bacterium]|nr:hypothetical protein [Desulfobacterales bacterium]